MRLLSFAVLVLLSAPAAADIAVRDDVGETIRLGEPAKRIVSLAPHVTETLYAAGAGGRLVGAVDYSDHPEAARRLPRVGGYTRLDLEAIVALKPDLVIGWAGGNSPAQIARLKSLGLPVYLAQPSRIEDVAGSLERYGQLAGTADIARPAAAAFLGRLAALRERHAGRPRLRVFYQIWRQPLMTVGGGQVISDAIRLCGGENVFGELKPLAAQVTVEAVLAADPEAIVASGMGEARPEWLDDWRQWPRLTAVARGNLFFVPPDLIQRHTPRLVDGAERLCTHLETARGRRKG